MLFFLVVNGCAGYRGGWESVPYVGQPPVVQSAGSAGSESRPSLVFPGVRLEVSIDNKLRTYDNQVYLFALPLSIDPRKVYASNNDPGKTRVFVTATPAEPGFVFRPSLAVLGIAEKRLSGLAGYEFGMWSADGKRVSTGGTWGHRRVEEALVLDEPGRKYHLSIDFSVPVPSPESSDIAVDLGSALASPQHPAIPLIRFLPVRWKEGYT